MLSKKTATQDKKIMTHFKEGGSLTPNEAWFIARTMKLSTRVSVLKTFGKNISSKWVKDKKHGFRFMIYWMPDYIKGSIESHIINKGLIT